MRQDPSIHYFKRHASLLAIAAATLGAACSTSTGSGGNNSGGDGNAQSSGGEDSGNGGDANGGSAQSSGGEDSSNGGNGSAGDESGNGGDSSEGGTSAGGAGGANGGDGGAALEGGGTSSGGASTAGGSPGGDVCDAVTDTGPRITTECGDGDLPSGEGGEVQDGVYYLTSKVVYDAGCETQDDGGVLVVTNGGTSWRIAGGTGFIGLDVETDGIDLVGTDACGDSPDALVTTYTATETTITLFHEPNHDAVTFTLTSDEAVSGPSVSMECNTIENVADLVTDSANIDAAPEMTGGELSDGTYVRTANIRYGRETVDEVARRNTLQIDGDQVHAVFRTDDGADVHWDLAYETSGTNDMTLTVTCGGSATVFERKYSATDSGLMLLNEEESTLEVYEIE